jgi:phosphoenolpyruvate-protein phosphotransferase (PTS system enzyme I)
VGLYRTETLFMQHVEDFPDEAEQYRTYRRLFQLAGRRPVVVRTADLGADKPVAHMSLGPQVNPYLGLRAHRIFHFHPEILVTQVRAILRAAAGDHDLRLMFPMLEMIEQWDFVQRLVGRAVASLKAEGAEFQEDFQQGVLIETPSAVLSFPEFLEVVDFVSVGTNDLVQYLFAVERDAVNVSDLYLPEHPVVLRCIRSMVKRARAAGKPLSVCGEIAADPALAEVLVGLGVENLSMSPVQAQAMGRHLADVTGEHCKALARQCLWARTAEEVREHLNIKPRAEVDQMAETLPEGHAVDPVCGMIVHTRTSDFTLERFGRRFFFCSLRCMRRFDRENPETTAPGGAG